CQKYRTSPYTF
nr:immunoglobulin light chain junction region [Macaca mulatta]